MKSETSVLGPAAVLPPASQQARPDLSGGSLGAIPYRIRIGVTGQPMLPDDPSLRETVQRAIDRVLEIVPRSPHTPVRAAVVSTLSEGANRLVAGEVLKLDGATLEVSIPLGLEEYRKDFATPGSQQEFDEYLERARIVVTMPPAETREEAYDQAGQYVVERSDVLIAVWDGELARGRGGIAEDVARARERSMPLFWIHTEWPYTLTEELGEGIGTEPFDKQDEFNRQPIDSLILADQLKQTADRLASSYQRAGLDPTVLQQVCAWILPYFVRADVLADRNQRTFFRSTASIFYFAAAAVAVVAGQKLFFPALSLVALIEVALMLSILGILVLSRRWKLHEHWISYRFLAEHFRSRVFLALAGVRDGGETVADRVYLEHPNEGWLARALDEVWGARPAIQIEESMTAGLRQFLSEAWIGDQLNYQRKASHRNHLKHQWLARISVLIFAFTLVAALLHVLDIGRHLGHEAGIGDALIFLAIALPAVAGAIRGVDAQREYHRNAERYGQMVRYLDIVKRRMDRAPDLPHIRAVAQEAESLMLSENRDWFVVMQFHDVELHV